MHFQSCEDTIVYSRHCLQSQRATTKTGGTLVFCIASCLLRSKANHVIWPTLVTFWKGPPCQMPSSSSAFALLGVQFHAPPLARCFSLFGSFRQHHGVSKPVVPAKFGGVKRLLVYKSFLIWCVVLLKGILLTVYILPSSSFCTRGMWKSPPNHLQVFLQ